MADLAKIQRVTNCNVLDGAENWFGRAEEVKLPKISAITTDYKGLGMVGNLKLPSGVGDMEMSIKWTAIYEEVLAKHSSIFTPRLLQIRSEITGFGSTGVTERVSLVAFVTAWPTQAPSGTEFKQHEQAGKESEYSVSAYKLRIAGRTIVEIDKFANIYIVDGQDILAETNANLGI